MTDKFNRNQRKNITQAAKLIGIILIIGGVIFFLSNRSQSPQSSPTSTQEVNALQEPIQSVMIGKSYDIPLTDSAGAELANLKYEIESAETRKDILVKGSKATAIDGRVFLILNLKITNQSEKGVNVNTRNYIRLSSDAQRQEWLAPDIHNDPVEVQAISTKKTRVGFPINEADKNLVIQFGEIDGDKDQIDLNLE